MVGFRLNYEASKPKTPEQWMRQQVLGRMGDTIAEGRCTMAFGKLLEAGVWVQYCFQVFILRVQLQGGSVAITILVTDALRNELMDIHKEGVLASTNQPKLAWLKSARISPTRRFSNVSYLPTLGRRDSF